MVTTRSMSPTSRTKPWTVHSIRVSISLLQSPMVIHHLCYNHQWSFTICVTMAHSPFVLQSPIHHCNHQCHCQWWFTNPITICSGESLSFSMQVITPSQHRWVSNGLPVENDGGQVGQKNGINTTWVKGKSSIVWCTGAHHHITNSIHVSILPRLRPQSQQCHQKENLTPQQGGLGGQWVRWQGFHWPPLQGRSHTPDRYLSTFNFKQQQKCWTRALP